MLTFEEINFLEVFGMLTENFMIKESMAYDELAESNEYGFTEEKKEVFKNNAEYYRSAIKRYKEIIKKLEESSR